MVELSWFEDYGDHHFQGHDMSHLKMDEAYLTTFIENTTNTYRIFRRHTECLKCPYVKLEDLMPSSTILDGLSFILKQVPHNIYRISTENVDILRSEDKYICELGEDFGEFGVYHLNISKTNNCAIGTIKQPVSIAFPVLTMILIYCAVLLCVFGSVYLWKRYVLKTEKNATEKKETKKRIQSLDTVRGISIVVMIFVNYGGGGYDSLEHATWNGLHLADLVFPWFMWIMGACIPISLLSSFKKQISNKDIFLNVLKRSIKLFCLGIFVGSLANLECMRIFGVLQRFGIAYLVVTTICLFLMKRDISAPKHKIGKFFGDFVNLYKGWIVILIIFFVHCMLLFLLADEGCPKGYLGPGGLHDNIKYYNCTGGATGYIDKVILGKHMYQKPTIRDIYQSHAFDPEGILGCLTSIVQVYIGVQAGMILLVYKEDIARLVRWLSWAIVTGIIGGALCGFSKNDGVIPLNKNLWSISFVLVTSCLAFVLLSICYVLIDMKNWWSGKPFLFAGMNAILMYVGHEITDGHLPMRWTVYCDTPHGTHLTALTEHVWGAGFWVVVAYYLYKINYFFTV